MSDEQKIKIRRYGWKPDLPDARDHKLMSPRGFMGLPTEVDLSPGMPPVWDQGEIGSCTAHAALACYQYTAKEQKQREVNYSRLYEYYNTRIIEGTEDHDAGASIRSSIKAMNKYGVALESEWPYKVSKFAKRPTEAAYLYGAKKILRAYARVNHRENDIKSCLAQGNPITFGFSVFESFEGEEIAETGVMRMPLASESLIGGHAVVLCGYDDNKRMFRVRNSWSSSWGSKGYFEMPYAFALDRDHCDDFWCIIETPK